MELVNLTEHDLDKPVYRVFSLEKFITSINENSLHFVKPRTWDDPFEGFLFKCKICSKLDKKKYYEFEDLYSERFYAQCWSLKKESDLLWRVYAPNRDGILVQSSLRKIYENFSSMPGGKMYLGKIKYLSQEQIENDFGRLKHKDNLLPLVIQSLLAKREEFSEEQEIRIIYFSEQSAHKQNQPTLLGYDAKISSLSERLFDKVVIDPRLNSFRADSVIKLINSLGYKGNIEQSSLYKMPDFTITVEDNERKKKTPVKKNIKNSSERD